MTFLDGPRPRIIAHRGLASGAPENTLLAFLKALSAGATHLETDVHATADGDAVISHDPELTRVAGREVRVGQLTLAELRRIPLGHGQSFCSLAEALDAFPEARFNIDIKDEEVLLARGLSGEENEKGSRHGRQLPSHRVRKVHGRSPYSERTNTWVLPSKRSSSTRPSSFETITV